MATVSLSLSSIIDDAECQSRKTLNHETITLYAERMKEGDKFPPVIVYESDAGRYLSEGFHRYRAAQTCGLEEIECEVRQGAKRDAIWNSIRSNADHGERRTREDVRYSIEKAMKDPVWAKMSDRAIAEHVRCHHTTVSTIRNQLANLASCPEGVSANEDKKRTGRDGRKRSAPPSSGKKTADAKKTSGVPDGTPQPAAGVPTVKEVLDKEGGKIPNHLKPIFEDLSEYDEIKRLFAELSRKITALSEKPSGVFIHAQSVKSDLSNAKRGVTHSAPHAVCPWCKGKCCDVCRQSGFVNEQLFEKRPK